MPKKTAKASTHARFTAELGEDTQQALAELMTRSGKPAAEVIDDAIESFAHHLSRLDDWEEAACKDCELGVSREYYMVEDALWAKAEGGEGQLCITCLESRLGRELSHQDFKRVPLNIAGLRGHNATNRLKSRLEGFAPTPEELKIAETFYGEVVWS